MAVFKLPGPLPHGPAFGLLYGPLALPFRMHNRKRIGRSSKSSDPYVRTDCQERVDDAQAATTARYAHLADDPLRAAAADIGARIAAALGDDGNDSADVVELRK